MKCDSCQAEINPQWAHAIEINVCPFCGQNIMAEHLKNLLSALRETMGKLVEYPEQLNDWMLSNYNYIKTDSPQIGIYAPKSGTNDRHTRENKQSNDDNKSIIKIKTDTGGEQEVIVEKIKSEDETSEFFRRAEAVKPNIDGFKTVDDKTQHLKNMVKQIKNGTADNMLLDTDEMSEMQDSNFEISASPYAAALGGNDFVPSSLYEGDSGEDVPPIVQQMAASHRGTGKNELADLQKLQAMVEKSKKSFRG
jgi:hypothetical protein